jgi:hypothetical protein
MPENDRAKFDAALEERGLEPVRDLIRAAASGHPGAALPVSSHVLVPRSYAEQWVAQHDAEKQRLLDQQQMSRDLWALFLAVAALAVSIITLLLLFPRK